MPVSDYIRNLRTHVGHALLLLPGVAAVIHNAAGAVLLVRRADDGEWGLPAGAIDPGECPAQAVVREVWEETGLRVRPVRVIGVFGGEPLLRTTYPNGDQCEYTVIVYFCEVVGANCGRGTARPAGLRTSRSTDSRIMGCATPARFTRLATGRRCFSGRSAGFLVTMVWNLQTA